MHLPVHLSICQSTSELSIHLSGYLFVYVPIFPLSMYIHLSIQQSIRSSIDFLPISLSMYVSIYFPRQRFLSPQGVTQTQILRKPQISLRNLCTPQAKLWFPNETYENHKQTIGFMAKLMKTTRKHRFSYKTNENPSENSKKD